MFCSFSGLRRISILFAALVPLLTSSAQLRIVDYNTAGDARSGMQTILAAIGAESINGVSKAPDLFTLQEQNSSATTTQTIVDILNNLYGAGTYARSTLEGQTTGAGRQELIYNTTTVQLIAQATASTIIGTTAAVSQTMRYEVRPVGYDAAADFYVYVSHYKASSGTSNAARRNAEALQVRANADALGQGAHIIYTGDFNVYSSGASEPMWATLTGAGAGQAFDPINRPNWSGSANRDVHTQSPAAAGSGLVTGGMDDRFDFQLTSAEFLDNEGLSYMAGSYHAFGNTGTHTYDQDITTGSATALQARLPGYTVAQATAVLNALAFTSDHLPVVAQYQLPAMMSVNVAAAPGRVIVGGLAQVAVTVSNTAPVLVASGADELDYTVTGGGAAAGSFTGTDQALGSGNSYLLALESDVVGPQNGSVAVHSPSQAAANPDFSSTLGYTVLDHAKPFFVGGADPIALTLDFGTVAQYADLASKVFSIANWTSDLGETAGLDLDAILGSGDIAEFLTNLAAFSDLGAGDALGFQVSMSTDTPGLFDGTYTLSFSDEDLPGATGAGSLTLHVTGQVLAVPEPATAVLLLAALGIGGLRYSARQRHRQ